MNNRINQLFNSKNKNILSVYFTAGFPHLSNTVEIITELEQNGVDLIEIGIPFSDPTADGPVIQNSNEVALKNGMTVKMLFDQLTNIRERIKIPLLLMGYVNPVLKFGFNEFCRKCVETGIDGIIIPDLPLEEFQENYSKIFKEYNLKNILLITPQTSDERIQLIDQVSDGFIYMVSSASTTGAGKKVNDFKNAYFGKIHAMNLKNPHLIGFGISDHDTFSNACNYANGAIIGSAFVSSLKQNDKLSDSIASFVKKIKKNS